MVLSDGVLIEGEREYEEAAALKNTHMKNKLGL